MAGLLENCRKYFKTDNLYSVLGVKKTATESKVKKGYHKVSLKVHPDKVPEDEKEEATQKFQTLGKVYCVLSDKEKRAVYDETGEIDDEDDAIPQDRDWTAYWRLLFRKVTTEDIEDFEKNYKGSEEELEDLKTAYIEFKGDMTEILNNIMCSTVEDEPRFTKIIKGWIKKKTVPDFPTFSKESKRSKEKRKRKAEEEAAEAEELKEELGLKVDDSLKNMIQQRQRSREAHMGAFFDQLEEKYSQPKKAKTSTETSPSEDMSCRAVLRRMWRKYRDPKIKVPKVSSDRDFELHGRNIVTSITSSRQKRQLKEEGRPVRSGHWLPGEDRILIKNLKKYHKKFPEYDPIEILHSNKANPVISGIIRQTQFYSRMAEGLNRTTYAAFVRLKFVLIPATGLKKGTYTLEENMQIQSLFKLYGPKWTKIGAHLGRSEKSVSNKWLISTATKTGRWNETEDSLLLDAIRKFKESNSCVDDDLHDLIGWTEIAKSVPGRNIFQCRAHWLAKLRNDFLSNERNFQTVKWSSEKKAELVKLISDQNVCHEEDIDFDVIRKQFQESGFVLSVLQARSEWRILKVKVRNYFMKSFEQILDELTERWLC